MDTLHLNIDTILWYNITKYWCIYIFLYPYSNPSHLSCVQHINIWTKCSFDSKYISLLSYLTAFIMFCLNNAHTFSEHPVLSSAPPSCPAHRWNTTESNIQLKSNRLNKSALSNTEQGLKIDYFYHSLCISHRKFLISTITALCFSLHHLLPIL